MHREGAQWVVAYFADYVVYFSKIELVKTNMQKCVIFSVLYSLCEISVHFQKRAVELGETYPISIYDHHPLRVSAVLAAASALGILAIHHFHDHHIKHNASKGVVGGGAEESNNNTHENCIPLRDGSTREKYYSWK